MIKLSKNNGGKNYKHLHHEQSMPNVAFKKNIYKKKCKLCHQWLHNVHTPTKILHKTCADLIECRKRGCRIRMIRIETGFWVCRRCGRSRTFSQELIQQQRKRYAK